MKKLAYDLAPEIATLPTPVAGLAGAIAMLSATKEAYWCTGAQWLLLSSPGAAGIECGGAATVYSASDLAVECGGAS